MNARRDLRQREANPFPRVTQMPEAWRMTDRRQKRMTSGQLIAACGVWLVVFALTIWLASDQGMNVLSMIWGVK